MSTQPSHPSDAHRLPRRTVLAAGGALAGAGLLAACSSSSSSPAASASGTPAPSGGPASLGPTSAVPVGGGAVFDAGGEKVVVTQPSSGSFKAFSAVCTHQGCTVGGVAGGAIVCPCHGSKFDESTGAVLSGPATQPLAAVAVSVQGADLVLG